MDFQLHSHPMKCYRTEPFQKFMAVCSPYIKKWVKRFRGDSNPAAWVGVDAGALRRRSIARRPPVRAAPGRKSPRRPVMRARALLSALTALLAVAKLSHAEKSKFCKSCTLFPILDPGARCRRRRAPRRRLRAAGIPKFAGIIVGYMFLLVHSFI